jgi:hypothetical protein
MSAGRPPLYETPDELQDKIDLYFQEGIETKTVVIGPPNNRSTIEIEVPTITGLCYFLGFESRQSFYAYEKKPEFSYTIKKARLFIEKHYEEMLQTGNTTGAIFALKNFDWSDKQEIDQKTTFEDKRLDLSKLTDEELRTLAEIQRKSGTSEAEV